MVTGGHNTQHTFATEDCIGIASHRRNLSCGVVTARDRYLDPAGGYRRHTTPYETQPSKQLAQKTLPLGRDNTNRKDQADQASPFRMTSSLYAFTVVDTVCDPERRQASFSSDSTTLEVKIGPKAADGQLASQHPRPVARRLSYP